MPQLLNKQPETLVKQLRDIFNPARNRGDETPTKQMCSGAIESVAVQIQQLAAPLINSDYRVTAVRVGESVRYMVVDVSDNTYTVRLSEKGLGSCTCNSKFFCHHILAVRIRAGLQDDLKIPPNAKLPKLTEMDKRYKGRRDLHGTKKPIKADAVHAGIDKRKRTGNQSTQANKKAKMTTKAALGREEEEEEEEDEEEEDFQLPEPNDVLFLSIPSVVFAKKSAPPPAGVHGPFPDPILVAPPPLTRGPSLPSYDVTQGFVDEVLDQERAPSSAQDAGLVVAPMSLSDLMEVDDHNIAASSVSPKQSTPKGGAGKPRKDDKPESLIARQPSVPSSDTLVAVTPGIPIKASTPISQPAPDDDSSDSADSYANYTPLFAKNRSTPQGSDALTVRTRRSLNEDSIKAMLDLSDSSRSEGAKTPEKTPEKKKRKSVSFAMDVVAVTRGSEFPQVSGPFTELSEQLLEKDLRMGLGEMRNFQFRSKKFVFETKEAGLVIIHTEEDDDDVRPVVKSAAATAGASFAMSRPNTKECGKTYFVRVALHLPGQDEANVNVLAEYEISCWCGKAIKRGELGSNIINCSSCNRMFHKEHVPSTASRKRQYTCLACDMPLLGVRWGAGPNYHNTCPIDGFLTVTALASLEQPSLLQDLKAFEKTPEETLAEAITMAQCNDSEEAQRIWGDYISYHPAANQAPLDSPGNLKGDIYLRTVLPLGPSVTFASNTVCPKGSSCKSRKAKSVDFKECSLPQDAPSVAEGMEYVFGKMIKVCDRCKDENGQSLVGFKTAIIPNRKQPPLFLHLTTISLEFTPEDYMNGPQELVVDGVLYRLRCIHLHTSAEPTHFRALISTGKRNSITWLLYDGLANNDDITTKFRPAVPSDYSMLESVEKYRASALLFIKE